MMHLQSVNVLFLFVFFAAATIGVTKTLAARNAREQWETVFNKHYVQPVLGSLEQKVRLAMHTILTDDEQG